MDLVKSENDELAEIGIYLIQYFSKWGVFFFFSWGSTGESSIEKNY